MSATSLKFTYEKDRLTPYEQHMNNVANILQSYRNDPYVFVAPCLEQDKKENDIVWKNFADCCTSIKRDKEHVYYYITKRVVNQEEDNEEDDEEKDNEKEKEAIFPASMSKYDIIKLYKDYIHTFVTCCMCKSNRSLLEKNIPNQFYILYCANCFCTMPVEKIKLYPV